MALVMAAWRVGPAVKKRPLRKTVK